jgi:hypothetical protein
MKGGGIRQPGIGKGVKPPGSGNHLGNGKGQNIRQSNKGIGSWQAPPGAGNHKIMTYTRDRFTDKRTLAGQPQSGLPGPPPATNVANHRYEFDGNPVPPSHEVDSAIYNLLMPNYALGSIAAALGVRQTPTVIQHRPPNLP